MAIRLEIFKTSKKPKIVRYKNFFYKTNFEKIKKCVLGNVIRNATIRVLHDDLSKIIQIGGGEGEKVEEEQEFTKRFIF